MVLGELESFELPVLLADTGGLPVLSPVTPSKSPEESFLCTSTFKSAKGKCNYIATTLRAL